MKLTAVSSLSRGQADTTWPKVPGRQSYSYQAGHSKGLEMTPRSWMRIEPLFGPDSSSTAHRCPSTNIWEGIPVNTEGEVGKCDRKGRQLAGYLPGQPLPLRASEAHASWAKPGGLCSTHISDHHTQGVTPFSYQRETPPAQGQARLSRAASCKQRKFSKKCWWWHPEVGRVCTEMVSVRPMGGAPGALTQDFLSPFLSKRSGKV